MVKPEDPTCITLADLMASRTGHTVVSMLVDTNGFWMYDNRESLRLATLGVELRLLSRFIAGGFERTQARSPAPLSLILLPFRRGRTRFAMCHNHALGFSSSPCRSVGFPWGMHSKCDLVLCGMAIWSYCEQGSSLTLEYQRLSCSTRAGQ